MSRCGITHKTLDDTVGNSCAIHHFVYRTRAHRQNWRKRNYKSFRKGFGGEYLQGERRKKIHSKIGRHKFIFSIDPEKFA
jgi:hypothetical protein